MPSLKVWTDWLLPIPGYEGDTGDDAEAPSDWHIDDEPRMPKWWI